MISRELQGDAQRVLHGPLPLSDGYVLRHFGDLLHLLVQPILSDALFQSLRNVLKQKPELSVEVLAVIEAGIPGSLFRSWT